MLTTLALTIFIGSIIVFFSEELRKSVLRALKNRKFQLIAPLFLASWIVVYHGWPVLTSAITYRLDLYYMVCGLAKRSPWVSGEYMVVERILVLFLLPALLLGITDLILLWKKPHQPKRNVRHIVLQVCAFVWTIAAFLLMMTLSEYFF